MATGQTISKIHDMLDPEGRLLIEVLEQTKVFIREHTFPRIQIDMTTGSPVYSCPWCENTLEPDDIRMVETVHTVTPSHHWDEDDRVMYFDQENRDQKFDTYKDGTPNLDRKFEDETPRWQDLHLFHKSCGYPVTVPLNWSVDWTE